MKKVITIIGALYFVSFILTSCGGNISNKNSNGYSDSKYTAERTLEGYTKQYLEFNFISDSTCIFFQNQYDIESDKFYDYEGSKKNYMYYVDNKHLVFVKTGDRGLDTMRIEIRGNKLVWHSGNVTKGVDGYPQIELSRN
jgi:hypothetical protein